MHTVQRRGPHKYYFTALFCKPLVATLVHLALLALAAFITSLGGTGFRHEPPAALPAGAPPSLSSLSLNSTSESDSPYPPVSVSGDALLKRYAKVSR